MLRQDDLRISFRRRLRRGKRGNLHRRRRRREREACVDRGRPCR